MPEKINRNRATEDGSLCKANETLKGLHCNLPGEVTYRGSFVCGPHARLLGTEDHTVLLRGIVSTLDLCLQSLTVRRDAELMETLRFERAEAAQELARAREDLRLAESDGSM